MFAGCEGGVGAIAPGGQDETSNVNPASGGDGEASDTSTAEEEGPCAPSHSCAAPAPEGWQGPVVRSPVAPGEDAPPCTDPWEADLAFFDDYLEPGPAQCSCECVVELAELCYTGVWRHEESQTCDSYSEFVVLDETGCVPLEPTSGSMSLNLIGSGVPECVARLDSSIPDPKWGKLVVACVTVVDGDACDDAGGRCLPPAPNGYSAERCIYRSGNEACPAGTPYAEKSLAYNGVAEDTRGCALCSCGEVGSMTCAGAAEAYSTDDCAGDGQVSIEPGACSAPVEGVASVRVVLEGPRTCEKVVETQVQGAIEPGPLFTYCCEANR